MIDKCRSCESTKLTEILNLGEQYLSDFRKDDSKPPQYPLIAVICKNCMLVQLDRDMPQDEMYTDNYGFKSGISDSIKADLKDVVSNVLEYNHNPKYWLDIASNDGFLLSQVPIKTVRYGCDPVTKYCKEAEQYANKIVNDYFTFETTEWPKFDVVTSISCFYDMPDPNKFVGDVAKVLQYKGIWIIQQNYLLPTMELGAIDNFCHEHLEYYTLLSLEPLLSRHGLEVVDVRTSTVNGGSIRTVVAHKGQYPVQDSVEIQRTIELDVGLDDVMTYLNFAVKALDNIKDLKNLVKSLKEKGKSICILAASTRGSTIWQCAGFTDKEIDYAVERNPEKVGKYFSAIGVHIVSEGIFRKNKPDYILVGPWFFKDELVKRESDYIRQGGKLVFPLPKLEIWPN